MRRVRLYLPLITILATVLVLFILLGFSTVRNLHRQRVRMEESLFTDGVIVLRSLEASFRSGTRGRTGTTDSLQWLMSEIWDLTDIRYVGLVDSGGTIIAHSSETLVGTEYPQGDRVRQLVGREGPGSWFGPEGQFIVAKLFRPVRGPMGMMSQGWGHMHPMMGSRSKVFESLFSNKVYAVVGLDTRRFEEARRNDMRHAVMMGLILLVLGSAGLYFIFIIQNYYIVNKTLDTMTTYTSNVVENMPDGLISIDAEGKIVTVNSRAKEIFGLRDKADEREELRTMFLSFSAPILESLKDRTRVVEQEVDCPRDPERYIPLSVSAARLISDDGEDLGAVFILRDLREIRDLQERVKRSERLAALGSLAAGVAHEIRNPLSSIKGFAQFFRRKNKPGSVEHNYSEVMIKEVDRLNRVISNLLDFAKPKEPTTEKVSIGDLVRHSVELIQDDARSKGVEVSVECEDGLPLADLDRDQITQVLLNVALNGLDAMGEGGKLCVRCFRRDDGTAVVVEVEDTGSGIPEKELPRVFDPFFTTKKRGTGLGLAIAHRIVENHQGNISVSSAVGSGTTFRIELPTS